MPYELFKKKTHNYFPLNKDLSYIYIGDNMPVLYNWIHWPMLDNHVFQIHLKNSCNFLGLVFRYYIKNTQYYEARNDIWDNTSLNDAFYWLIV